MKAKLSFSVFESMEAFVPIYYLTSTVLKGYEGLGAK
jgi:hypothetical protein